MREILQLEDDLTEIVQLVGKDSLGEPDKITLEIARLIREDFLQQNGFKDYDRYCPFYKTIWMMKNFISYYDLAQKALEDSPQDIKISWAQIAEYTQAERERLSGMKFETPANPEKQNIEKFQQLYDDIEKKFKAFSDQFN